MITSKLAMVLILTLVPAVPRFADDTGTVSIVGKNVDSSDTKAFGITLVLADKRWIETEPGSISHFFQTKKGKFVFVPGTNTVFLCKTETVLNCAQMTNAQAGQLIPINPSSAHKGDTGTGQAEETGISFKWEVK